MKKFHNNNGRSYYVLEQVGKYSLLELAGKDYEPYVVAFLLDEEAGEWNSGNYFNNLEDARQSFEDKTQP